MKDGRGNSNPEVEKDGYTGTLCENAEGRRFVNWHLATLSADSGQPVTVTGVSAENGSPKAAAWNLTHRRNGSLERVLRARIQFSRDTAGIQVSVPGPQIQGESSMSRCR